MKVESAEARAKAANMSSLAAQKEHEAAVGGEVEAAEGRVLNPKESGRAQSRRLLRWQRLRMDLQSISSASEIGIPPFTGARRHVWPSAARLRLARGRRFSAEEFKEFVAPRALNLPVASHTRRGAEAGEAALEGQPSRFVLRPSPRVMLVWLLVPSFSV